MAAVIMIAFLMIAMLSQTEAEVIQLWKKLQQQAPKEDEPLICSIDDERNPCACAVKSEVRKYGESQTLE